MEVDKKELKKLMTTLDSRKAMGPDNISGQVLRECSTELIEPIYDTITSSINTGKVPVEWKRADMEPVYENEDEQEPLNCRPVSLTSVVCIICESMIKKTMGLALGKKKIW